jgi:hypothetical protein
MSIVEIIAIENGAGEHTGVHHPYRPDPCRLPLGPNGHRSDFEPRDWLDNADG